MFIRNLRSGRRLAALAIFAVIAVSATGFAATNTVPDSKAGDGAGTISGYVASSVHYNLNATNPQTIDSVTLTLDSTPVAGSTIKAKLVAAGGTWYTCANVAANVTCVTTGATVATADELRVVVAD